MPKVKYAAIVLLRSKTLELLQNQQKLV